MNKFFVGFVTAGDGGIDYCVDCCVALVEGGVNILELGMPFSDPVADGPVIQAASERALALGTTPETVLMIAECVKRKVDIPIVAFGYCNPLLQQGAGYLKRCKAAGIDAVLVVDLPPPHPFYEYVNHADMYPVVVVAPSTTNQRLEKLAKHAKGFIYYACQKGTTGVRKQLPADFAQNIKRIREHSPLPIAAGFGISNRETAQEALNQADGFVVGSTFVQLMADKTDPSELMKTAKAIDPRGPL